VRLSLFLQFFFILLHPIANKIDKKRFNACLSTYNQTIRQPAMLTDKGFAIFFTAVTNRHDWESTLAYTHTVQLFEEQLTSALNSTRRTPYTDHLTETTLCFVPKIVPYGHFDLHMNKIAIKHCEWAAFLLLDE
jgi:hypothetical protein